MINNPILSTSKRPKVMVIGPNPSQIGGVATFLGVLLSSATLQGKYELIHLDTARGKHGVGLESRFAITNIIYFTRQAVQFLAICLRDKPQIVHLPINYSWAFWKGAAFILLARVLGIKVVAHVHGGMFHQYVLGSSSFSRWLIGRVLHRANVVIALSSHWRDFLLKEVRSDLNVEVVPNTVDPMFASAINKPKATNSEKMVLFVGGLGHRKGVFDILKAVPIVVSGVGDTRFLFAGNEESRKVGEEIKRRCAEGKLNEFVKFLGVVTGQEKLDLLRKATIFVLPSYGENLPYALLEAMSTGLPVVATPVGAIPGIVEDGKNGFLIEPGDYEALADRIIKLLRDSTLRHEMALANTALIQKDYMPETASHRFNQIYSNLISMP